MVEGKNLPYGQLQKSLLITSATISILLNYYEPEKHGLQYCQLLDVHSYQKKLKRIEQKSFKEQKDWLKKNPPPRGFGVLYSKGMGKHILKALSQNELNGEGISKEEPSQNPKPKRGYGDTSKYRNALSPLTKEMAAWVSQHKWTHWCTFTFRQETSDNGARRQIERMYERFSNTGLRSLYYVIEEGSRYDRIHGHALGVFESQSADIVWQFWKSKIGRCQIRPFETEKGAVEYITNYMKKGTIDWDFLGKPKKKP